MKRVCLGKITSAHGVKGLVKILPFGDDPGLIETLSPVFTGEISPGRIAITMKSSAGNKYWLASVEGVVERDGAEALRGTELWVNREDLPKIDEKNTYYHADLIGLRARDENGTVIGEIVSVQNFGAGDLLEISPDGLKTYYLPFNNDYVRNIDLQGRTATIMPQGLDE